MTVNHDSRSTPGAAAAHDAGMSETRLQSSRPESGAHPGVVSDQTSCSSQMESKRGAESAPKADGMLDFLPPGVTHESLCQELRQIAAAYMKRERADHTLQPTALVHEVLVRLSKKAARERGTTSHPWATPAEFFRVAAVAMQRLLIDHARHRNAARRGGGLVMRVSPEQVDADLGPALPDVTHATIDRLEQLQDALRKLEAIDPRAVDVVRLRFFAGLSIAETAAALDVGTTTVEADWRFVRAWLERAIPRTSP